jgi:hypothetical protein
MRKILAAIVMVWGVGRLEAQSAFGGDKLGAKSAAAA